MVFRRTNLYVHKCYILGKPFWWKAWRLLWLPISELYLFWLFLILKYLEFSFYSICDPITVSNEEPLSSSTRLCSNVYVDDHLIQFVVSKSTRRRTKLISQGCELNTCSFLQRHIHQSTPIENTLCWLESSPMTSYETEHSACKGGKDCWKIILKSSRIWASTEEMVDIFYICIISRTVRSQDEVIIMSLQIRWKRFLRNKV